MSRILSGRAHATSAAVHPARHYRMRIEITPSDASIAKRPLGRTLDALRRIIP
jgi:hypothetical protein